jgi:Protein of unknown function with PCYCGC motif
VITERSLKNFLILTVLIGLTSCSSRYQPPPVAETKPAPHATTDAHAPKPNAPVPAHFNHPPSNLGPTLPAEDFTGKTRAAYRVAKEIPETLAQLPCYCHCDRGMGHKSLHSCFEDDHAAHCAVCVDEALLADRLQKSGLTPAQIREKIVAQYSEE